jgi:hypothetical protein
LFDPFGNETLWLKEHVALVKGYGSFALEHYVAKGLPTIDYHDAATEGYAPLTPERRKAYLAKVEADRAQGFIGVHNDDVNFGLSYRDGNQNKSSYEPEAKELGLLIEEERKLWPEAIIETNTQWHDLSPRLTDPNVERMIANSTTIYKEFGVGPTAGVGTRADYESLLGFNEHLQLEHKGMTFGGDYGSNTVEAMEYTLATELLGNQGYDHYSTAGKYALPPTWWTGSDVDLGEAISARQRSSAGVWTRSFSHGVVFALEPGAATQTIVLPVPMRTVSGETVSSVTLTAAHGVVLRD